MRRGTALVNSPGCRACLQIRRNLIGRHYPASLDVLESGPELLPEVGIGEDFDSFPQPVELTGGHHIGHVFAVRDDCDGLSSLSAAHGIFPPRGLLTGRVQVVRGNADRLLAHGP